MTILTDNPGSKSLQVALDALPDAIISMLAGIYDVMKGLSLIGSVSPGSEPPFRIEIVGEMTGALPIASGALIEEVVACDIVIVPSVLPTPSGLEQGRYPRLEDWLRCMHEGGAMLCSACSGVFTKTRRFSGGCSSAGPGWHREPTASD